MPIYEYRCDGCLKERELSRPMDDRDMPVNCGCGKRMRRLMPLTNFTAPETGRDKILGTLNQEEGARDFPGGDKHRTRYERAMSKSLDQTRPVIGRGF